MSPIYLVVHDDRYYDMGDSYVRWAFVSRADAEASVATRTPSGRITRSAGHHDETCCSVDEWAVRTEPASDFRPDPPDPPPLSPLMARVVEVAIDAATRPNPYRQALRPDRR